MAGRDDEDLSDYCSKKNLYRDRGKSSFAAGGDGDDTDEPVGGGRRRRRWRGRGWKCRRWRRRRRWLQCRDDRFGGARGALPEIHGNRLATFDPGAHARQRAVGGNWYSRGPGGHAGDLQSARAHHPGPGSPDELAEPAGGRCQIQSPISARRFIAALMASLSFGLCRLN